MTISAAELTEALRCFRQIESDLSAEFMENMAKGLIEAQDAQKSLYEDSWNAVINRINELIGGGNGLGDIIQTLIYPGVTDTILQPAIAKNNIKYDLCAFENTPGKVLCAYDGAYRLIDESYVDFRLIESLSAHLSADVDTIVEFGAGWGKNLALLLMNSGRSDVKYMACEQSDSGRNSFDRLFGLINGLDYSSLPFDFYSPDFGMLDGRKNLLVFTCAAIEQIAFLPRSFIDGVLNAAENVTLIFYEPVGWQKSVERTNFAIKTYVDKFGGIVPWGSNSLNDHVFKFSDEHFQDNAMIWALFGNYNINLVNLINLTVEDQRAQLIDSQYDIYSENPMNPHSLFILKNN
jgi:hypothetical protein